MNKYYVALRSDLEGPYAYEPIYHEYFHSLSLPYMPGLPLWLAEGFADFYGNTVMMGKEAVARPAPMRNCSKSFAVRPADPARRACFKSTIPRPITTSRTRRPFFYAESWALVHYLMAWRQGLAPPAAYTTI